MGNESKLTTEQSESWQTELSRRRFKTLYDVRLEFPKRFSLRLEQLGMSDPGTAAQMLGLDRGTIRNYLKGTVIPISDSLAWLAQVLECSTDWLLGLVDESEVGQSEVDKEQLRLF